MKPPQNIELVTRNIIALFLYIASISCAKNRLVSFVSIFETSKLKPNELKKKQYRIDFIFTDDRLGSESVSGTIALAAELNTISDHYPVIVELDMSNHR